MSSPAISPVNSRAKRARAPRHAVETRAFRFPLAVTPAQDALWNEARFARWRLRNRLLLDRVANRAQVKAVRGAGSEAAALTRADQYRAVNGLCEARPGLGAFKVNAYRKVRGDWFLCLGACCFSLYSRRLGGGFFSINRENAIKAAHCASVKYPHPQGAAL